MQYFFKSCFAIVTTSLCSVSLMRMHWHLVPQQKKQSHTKAMMHWYTTSNRQGYFSQQGFLLNCLMMASLIATDDVYVHHPCQPSIFSSWNRFYVLDLKVSTYLSDRRNCQKSSISRQSYNAPYVTIDTRCPIANRNPIEGNKMAEELRLAANWFPPKAMNAWWKNTAELS